MFAQPDALFFDDRIEIKQRGIRDFLDKTELQFIFITIGFHRQRDPAFFIAAAASGPEHFENAAFCGEFLRKRALRGAVH